MQKYFALVLFMGITLLTGCDQTHSETQATTTKKEEANKDQERSKEAQEEANKDQDEANKDQERSKVVEVKRSKPQKSTQEISEEECKKISDIQNQRQCYLHCMEKNVQEQKKSSKRRKDSLKRRFQRTLRDYCKTFPKEEKVQICLVIESKGFNTSNTR
ncbi:MAG: hypothetical protein RBS56_01115 [Candidatus Gracilibacteria bacterium]|nr:hypothetical protein [Candidatus Gracilibacteria bacterium]